MIGVSHVALPKELIILCLKKRQASVRSSAPNTVLERDNTQTLEVSERPYGIGQAARHAKGSA